MVKSKVVKLLVLTTGGTIAGEVDESAALHGGSDIPTLLESLDQARADICKDSDLLDEIRLETREVAEVDSSNIEPSHWVKIIDTIADNYWKFDGFIVTHGTNTMGYTAAALSFALENLGKPVVVTGSQVPHGWPGSDALMNLQNSLRVATWHKQVGGPNGFKSIRGVVCVFGSHIITGTRAKKSTEFDYDAFQSFSTASLGRIGRVIRWNVENVIRHLEYLSGTRPEASLTETGDHAHELSVVKEFDARVLSFTEFPGMNATTFESLSAHLIGEARLKGVVFRAFGAGDVSTNLHPAFAYLKEQEIPIVVTTQAPNGNSNFSVNQPGIDLAKKGLATPAYDMSIESMTTKLMWLLGQELSYAEINRMLIDDLHGEVSKDKDRRG